MNIVEEDIVDAREIDKVITEVAGMSGRWSMFRKFLYDRLKVTCLLAPLDVLPCLPLVYEDRRTTWKKTIWTNRQKS